MQEKGGRARGVIFDPGRKKEMEYAWGLEDTTNNEAESITICQGLVALKAKGVQQETVIRDSTVILRSLFHQIPLQNFKLSRLTQRIINLTL